MNILYNIKWLWIFWVLLPVLQDARDLRVFVLFMEISRRRGDNKASAEMKGIRMGIEQKKFLVRMENIVKIP